MISEAFRLWHRRNAASFYIVRSEVELEDGRTDAAA